MIRMRICALVLCTAGVVTTAPVDRDSTVWTVIAFDPKSDGRAPGSADAALLSYRYDKATDTLWFRLSTYGSLGVDPATIRLGIDTGGTNDSKLRWPGVNNTDFTYDRLITITAGRPEGDGYVQVEGEALVVAIRRRRLTDAMTLKVVAALGSGDDSNDDLPNTGSASIDLLAPRPVRGLREIDTSRNNLVLPDQRTGAAGRGPANVVQSGHGPRSLILVPGIYSGRTAFDGFVARNASRYTFHTITPRGLNGTAPAPMPAATVSYGELTWTRILARDILDLIEATRLEKPIILTHGFPGSLAAEELALSQPEKIGGIVEIASMAVQPYPSPTPGREATPSERVAVVDEAWAKQWFKYVTPDTWERNNYPAEMFANDAIAAERARQQVEAVTLPVKIRYLIEFMASDPRPSFAALTVPWLLIKPGFNDALLSDPTFVFFKASFQDGWNRYPANPRVESMTIPDARALVLDDQPALADRAIDAFVKRTSGQRR